MHRLFRYLRLATVLLLVVVSTVAMTAFYYLQGSAPQWQGRLIVPGLRDRVEILRTEQGVPDIRANHPRDVAFAMGFTQAQDHFFAMDILRRRPAGELAELVGPTGLDSDRRTVPLDLQASVDRLATQLAPETREQLSAYARGVNAALDQMAHAPLEYLIMRAEPRRWTINDSLLVFAGLRLRVDQPAWAMAALEQAAGDWPDALSSFLFSPGFPAPASASAIPAPPEGTNRQADPFRPLPAGGLQSGPATDGVARWTGQPGLPWPWYPVRWQRQGEPAIAGVVLLGAPAMFAGSDGASAWRGLPSGEPSQPLQWTTGADTSPETDNREPVTESEVNIRVRGQRSQQTEIRSTRWGPVVIDGENGYGVAGTLRAQAGPIAAPAHLAPWLYPELGPSRTMVRYANDNPATLNLGARFETVGDGWLPLHARGDYPDIDWAYWRSRWQAAAGGEDAGFETVRAYRHATLMVLFGGILDQLAPAHLHQSWPLLSRALEQPARAVIAFEPDSWLPSGLSRWSELPDAALAATPDTASALRRASAHPLAARLPALAWLFRLTSPTARPQDGFLPLWLETPAQPNAGDTAIRTAGPINRHPFRILEEPTSDPTVLIRQNGSVPIGHQLNLLPEREQP